MNVLLLGVYSVIQARCIVSITLVNFNCYKYEPNISICNGIVRVQAPSAKEQEKYLG
jgi:hypothetical protein